jgi:hypothetical protein|uniref:Uncharacterized protein n=1 Tax=Fagus sylvatica TaxID=28930 RepID=A0A2N9FVT0_FAGSY
MVRMLECRSERGEDLRAEREVGELRWPWAQGDGGGDNGGARVEATLEEASHR